MEKRTATLIGASGLIGSHLKDLLTSDGYYDKIRIVSRRAIEVTGAGTELVMIDFTDEEAYRKAIAGSDAVFCAVGTTQKKVNGDRSEYRKVDHDIPVSAARFCAETGCPQFLLVSSTGAKAGSSNFYLDLKGEVEDTVAGLGISSVSVFRPSMLLGKRNEFRLGEIIGKAMAVPFSFLMPQKYKPVKARDVAGAMIAASKQGIKGFNIYDYPEIMMLTGRR